MSRSLWGRGGVTSSVLQISKNKPVLVNKTGRINLLIFHTEPAIRHRSMSGVALSCNTCY